MFETLPLILVLLISSVLAVALFRALRLPAMLAYFLVGMALGPHTFGYSRILRRLKSLLNLA